jgi:flagellar biosynthesis/type III secretory pathway M-ring protein FliF/YscJ
MNTSNTVWIVTAVVAVLVIVALVIAARRAARRRREREAEGIRERAQVETAKVERREALAAETAAKARAAQAEAEAKAAEAARLQDRASTHQTEAASSREQLDEQWKRADSLDPTGKAEKDAAGGEAAADRDSAWSKEQPIPDKSPTGDMSADRRDR